MRVRELAERAKATSRRLAVLTHAQRNDALEAMASAIEAHSAEILAANQEDVTAAGTLRGEDALTAATTARLALSVERLREMAQQVRSVAALPDPLGRILSAMELDNRPPVHGEDSQETGTGTQSVGLDLTKISVPLGVLAVIFEARPDAVTQIASLAIKSGNAVLLKPGREIERTAAAVVRVLQKALSELGVGDDAMALVLGRAQAAEMLALHHDIDLVIPRGSRSLVEYVQANTRIPVLGHAEGVCHIYVDRAAEEAMALRIVTDAKLDYPAACNAVETVLVHVERASHWIPALVAHLAHRGVRIRGDAAVRQLSHAEPVDDWHCEYSAPELAIAVVDSMDSAIDHIHRFGSRHTECIVTEDAAAAERFLNEVDAASVFWNASTRFADGFRFGLGAEVGISTAKLHARGPVGLDGLTTYKYILRGHGHIAGDYRGADAREFTHRQRV